MAAVQRIQQGVRALFAFAYPVDYDLAERHLDDAQMALFLKLSRSEQLHAINVLKTLCEQVEAPPKDLIVAALLHDVGKVRMQLMVWQKTLAVLVKAFLPDLNTRLSANEQLSFWRGAFVVRRWHPKWSAELLQTTSASECTVWLARHHQDKPEQWKNHPYYPLLIQLQSADNAN